MPDSISAHIIDLLFGGMDKLGPGDDEITREMLRLIPVQKFDVVVDAGCGTGRQTLVVARELGAVVHAVDNHQPFLDMLSRKAASAGLGHLVVAHCMDMAAIPEAFPRIDLLWSEGAAYSIGYANALATWARAIRSGGYAAVSELGWLREDVPGEVREFFDAEYPDMRTADENAAIARDAGYEVLASRILPAYSWVDGYYDVLGPRADSLLSHPDPDVRRFAEGMLREIEIFRLAEGNYGNVFLLLRRT